MRRIVFALIALAAASVVNGQPSFAAGSNTDQSNCHHGYDDAKTKSATISDPAKKAQAYGHLKAAYAYFMAAKHPECISEVKAVDALTQ
jgi:hypothetical protein